MAENSATIRHHNFQDMTGQRIGRLLVVECVVRQKKKTLWRCRCDCGAEVISSRSRLLERRIKSCGCYVRIPNRLAYVEGASGQSIRPEFKIWDAMITRCKSPLHDAYKYYGGRGISVCDRWVHGDGKNSGFDCFFLDMGSKPTSKHSIDRYPDKDGNYTPENCRWASVKEQANNKSNNVWITVNGVTKTMTQWAEASGIPYKTVHNRIRVGGWSPQDAVTIPPRKMRRSS